MDTEGKVIKATVTDELAQPVGKDYDTVIDIRPKTIVTPDGKVYELVPSGNYTVGQVDENGHLVTAYPVTGKVIEGAKNVTYVYKLVKTPTPVEPTPSPKQLPNTGTADSVATGLMGAITGLAGLATLSRRRKDEN